MLRFWLHFVIFLFGCQVLHAAKLDSVYFQSRFLANDEIVSVIIPEKAEAENCPSIYLLHGYSDDHNSWVTIRPDLPEIADNYGVFFILPDGQDSWYWDSPIDDGMQMESFFTQELVPYINKNYRVIDSADKRAITGLSMGGQGAMWLAFRHPDIWKNVGSTSGGLDIRPFPERWKMSQRLGKIETHPENWENHAVINLIPSITNGQLNIIFDCGTSDFFYQVNEAFHKALIDAGIDHDYISRPGNHTRPYWANSILYQLLFFSEQFKR